MAEKSSQGILGRPKPKKAKSGIATKSPGAGEDSYCNVLTTPAAKLQFAHFLIETCGAHETWGSLRCPMGES